MTVSTVWPPLSTMTCKLHQRRTSRPSPFLSLEPSFLSFLACTIWCRFGAKSNAWLPGFLAPRSPGLLRRFPWLFQGQSPLWAHPCFVPPLPILSALSMSLRLFRLFSGALALSFCLFACRACLVCCRTGPHLAHPFLPSTSSPP